MAHLGSPIGPPVLLAVRNGEPIGSVKLVVVAVHPISIVRLFDCDKVPGNVWATGVGDAPLVRLNVFEWVKDAVALVIRMILLPVVCPGIGALVIMVFLICRLAVFVFKSTRK